MKEFIINENEAGQRFDKYLAKLLKEAPKSFFYKMMRKKNITLNGKKANGNEKLLSGDHVKLFLSDETFEKFSGTDKAPRAYHKLDIIYEDENILLINKPSGMLSQPGDDGTPSLVEYLTGYLLETGSLTEEDLRNAVQPVMEELGEPEKIEKTVVRGTENPETKEKYATAVSIVSYENGKAQYTITFNQTMKMEGFYIK